MTYGCLVARSSHIQRNLQYSEQFAGFDYPKGGSSKASKATKGSGRALVSTLMRPLGGSTRHFMTVLPAHSPHRLYEHLMFAESR
jgi:hypothetical protein